MLNDTTTIVNSLTPLNAVHVAHPLDAPHSIVAIELQFGSAVLTMRAEPTNDTISVSLVAIQRRPDISVVDSSRFVPWSDVIGHRLNWAWKLTNQLGYTDGVRLQFLASDADSDHKQNVGPAPRVVELLVEEGQFSFFYSVKAARPV